MVTKALNGDRVLYPYLQKELLKDDYWLFQMLAARLITALGVWISPEIYARVPILLPHVIRDESARRRRGAREAWASPDENGFLRDDNTLIKGLVKSLPFQSNRSHYQGRRIGGARGWVAAHVWQFRRNGKLTTRHYLTNSFVPNLVWLPGTLAALSDQNSFVQQYLQALSHKIYAGVEQPQPLRKITEEAWRELDVPDIPPDRLPGASELNYFAPDFAWLEKLRSLVADVLESLERTSRGDEPVETLRPTRYRHGLTTLRSEATSEFRAWLTGYDRALSAATETFRADSRTEVRLSRS